MALSDSIKLAALFCLFSSALCATATEDPCTASPSPTVTKWIGPLASSFTFADPSIVKTPQDEFYVFATSNTEGSDRTNVPFGYTSDLVKGPWTLTDSTTGLRSDAMPPKSEGGHGIGAWTEDPTGKTSGIESPDVNILPDGTYIIYYTAHSKTNGYTCLGVGYSDSPGGPYKPRHKPLFCPGRGGVLSAGFIRDEKNSKSYLYFKSPSCPGGSCMPKIQIFEVDNETGLRINEDQPTILTESLQGQDGEESPALTQLPDGRWLLLHTEGSQKNTYLITYAISEGKDILGPYADAHSTCPLIKSTDSSNGPLVNAPGGSDWITPGRNGKSQSNRLFIFAARTPKVSSPRKLYLGEMAYVSPQLPQD